MDFAAEIAYVVLNHRAVDETEICNHIGGLGQVRLPNLDAHHLGTVQRKLDSIVPFE